jgi:predicted MPP superfamily phosphohydrolase
MPDPTTTSGAPAGAPGRVRKRIPTRVWAAALLALAVVLLELARVFLVDPLHRQGVAQGLLSVPSGLSWILLVPGNAILSYLRAVPPVDRLIVALNGWRVFLVISFGFYFLLFCLLGSINRRWNRRIHRVRPVAPAESDTTEIPPEPRPTRRRVLRVIKRTVVTGVVAGGAYPLFVEPHRLEISRRSFPVRGLPPSLDGLRIVQLTDIHLGTWTSAAHVRALVEKANALEPDLIALTGDYVLRWPDYIPQAAAALSSLRAKVGVVGVLGNHDWYQDGPLSKRELEKAGVRMIDNDRVFLTPDRRLTDGVSEGLCLAGVGDLWCDVQLYDKALAGVPSEVPRLLLSHNPDVAEEQAFISGNYRVDLMLSGHTHGGQIRFPIVGAPVTMSRYGQKYARGLVMGPTCPVFVCRGLGMAMLPLRLGSIPEMAVIELRRDGGR